MLGALRTPGYGTLTLIYHQLCHLHRRPYQPRHLCFPSEDLVRALSDHITSRAGKGKYIFQAFRPKPKGDLPVFKLTNPLPLHLRSTHGMRFWIPDQRRTGLRGQYDRNLCTGIHASCQAMLGPGTKAGNMWHPRLEQQFVEDPAGDADDAPPEGLDPDTVKVVDGWRVSYRASKPEALAVEHILPRLQRKRRGLLEHEAKTMRFGEGRRVATAAYSVAAGKEQDNADTAPGELGGQ